MIPGDILLIAESDPISRLVEWATISPYSHAVLVADGHLLEALVGQGVVQSPLSKYEGSPGLFHARVLAANANQVDFAVKWAELWVGKRYGWREALTAGARDVLHVPIRPRGFAHLDCSGLIAAAYAAALCPLTRAIAPTPGDLWASMMLVAVDG